MKKLVLLGIMLLIASPVFAEVFHNDTIDSGGIGADIVVYNGAHPLLDEVRIDTRYDVDSHNVSVYGVVRVDLFSALQNRVSQEVK